MKRGFKTWAEKESVKLRKKLGLQAWECLPAKSLADDLGIKVLEPSTIPGMTPVLVRPLQRARSGFSAVTLPGLDPVLIIHNPSHAPARQESNLMHEIAHVICQHECKGVTVLGGLPCRDYDEAQEDEAEWLGACLQIPREGLLICVQNGWNNEAIASHFGASLQLTRFRRNKTGVDAQTARARANPRWRS